MTLRQHSRYDVSVVGTQHEAGLGLAPGSQVCHDQYRQSTYGIVVAVDDMQVTVLWSKEPPVELDVAKFKSLAAPLMRRVNYSGIAKQLIQVEPLPPGAHAYYAKDEK